jgi:hypothetical protein
VDQGEKKALIKELSIFKLADAGYEEMTSFSRFLHCG